MTKNMKTKAVLLASKKRLAAVGLAVLCSVVVSSATYANDLSLRIGEEAVWLSFEPQLAETHAMQFGLVHNADDDITVLSGGLFATGQRDQFSGRLGGKLYYADLDGDSGYGVALGGDLVFALMPRLDLIGGLYFGPSSISFSDVDGYEEWYIKARYQLFDNGAISGGFGSLELEPEEGRDIEVDDGLFIEMTLRF